MANQAVEAVADEAISKLGQKLGLDSAATANKDSIKQKVTEKAAEKALDFLKRNSNKREDNNHLTPLIPPPSPLREGRDEAFNMLLKLYDKNNNPQDLQRIIDILNDGGLIIYPTDTMYAIGCHGLKERAIERICRIKEIDPRKTICPSSVMT